MNDLLELEHSTGLGAIRIPEELFLDYLERCETVSEFRVVSFLQKHGPTSREVIVGGTDVKRTTVYDALVRLHIKGLVRRETDRSRKGRPLVLWMLAEK